MAKSALLKAIDAVLENWAGLDEWHRGRSYDEAVRSLVEYRGKLEAEACQ